MSLRAEWRLHELLGLEDDPFESVVLSTGLRVDLTGTTAEVLQGLKRSLEMEGNLFDRGVTCELKDGGQDCLECPMYVADRLEEPRAPLCRLGRDQRLMEERYKVLRLEPYVELAASVEPYVELGQLPEYLLTAAGP